MKPIKRTYAILAGCLLAVMAMTGCGGKEARAPLFPWPASGSVAIDSLMLTFQQRHMQCGDDARSLAIVGRMDSVAQSAPLPLCARSRIDYCKAQLAVTTGCPARASRLADNMLALLDSASQPYDYHSWLQIKATADGAFVGLYRACLDNLAYFRGVGDSLQAVKALIALSHIAIDIQDEEMARQYFAAIDTLLSHDPRLMPLKRRMDVNRALVGPPRARDSLLTALRNSPEIIGNNESAIVVLQNSFLLDNRLSHLDSALAMTSDTLQHFRRPILNALKASWFLENGGADSALFYARRASEGRPDGYLTPWSVEIYRVLSQSYEMCGMTDSAYSALLKVNELEDTMAAERQSAAIFAAENALRIKETRNAAKLEKTVIINRFLILLLILAVAIFILVAKWYRSAARHRLEAQQSSMKIKSATRSLQAYALAMDEHKRLVDDMNECVSATDGARQPLQTAISSILKKHNAREEGNLTFLKVQNDVDGDFARRLKADFPDITENQIRLAQLIAAGVSNSRLSGLLNVTTDSIHKSRYRLRLRFGLDKGASLEDFLRRYME